MISKKKGVQIHKGGFDLWSFSLNILIYPYKINNLVREPTGPTSVSATP